MKLTDQLVADEERTTVKKAKKLRRKNFIEYNRTVMLAEGRRLAQEDIRRAEEQKQKSQQKRG